MKDISDFVHNLSMFKYLSALLTTGVIIWFLQLLWSRRYLYLYSSKVPGPLSFPIYGSFISVGRTSHDAFIFLNSLFDKYPDIFRAWIGPILFYGVSHPEYIEKLLTKSLKKGTLYEVITKVLGPGLFTNPDVSDWKNTRRIITPTLSKYALDKFINVFIAKTDILIKNLEEYSGKGHFDIFKIIFKNSLDVAARTVIGVDTDILSKPDVMQYMERSFEIITHRVFNPILLPDFTFSFTSMSKEWKKQELLFAELATKIMREKIAAVRNKENFDQDHIERVIDEEPKEKCILEGFVEKLIEEKEEISEERLLNEVRIFLIAAADTIAITLSFVVTIMGMFPEMQERIYNEVIDTMGLDRSPEFADMSKLLFTERFIKEVLRVFPVGPYMSRKTEDIIDLGAYTIPKGAELVFPVRHVHLNERYWPDPYKFNPDRFLPKEIEKRIPGTFLPFSYGPRNCLGARYAMISLKTTIAMFVRKYTFSSPYKKIEDIELTWKILLRPKDDFKVSINTRDYVCQRVWS